MQPPKLASGATSATLALAYEEFNDMKCSRYQQNYQEAPPSYFYFDCVGFTGYTLERADPRAWASLRRMVDFQAGQVTPTPLEFVDFLRGLGARPPAGWRADPTAASIQAGDILAWQPLVPGVGHSVIPLVAPEPIAGSGDLRWDVVVEDSTQDPHGPLDTRAPRQTRSASATPWRPPAKGKLRNLLGWASAPWCWTRTLPGLLPECNGASGPTSLSKPSVSGPVIRSKT